MADEPVISVEGLRKSFGSMEILRGIDFTVQRGETLVILGRSGTGKSVTLKLLIGLLSPSAGRAAVFGEELYALPKRRRFDLRRRLGYVFQGGALFDSLTILENVGFPLFQARVPEAEIERRVRDRLQMVGLAHTIWQYPPDLSGGMQKRASLARAIIDLPEVVFYDEPTSGLDPLTTDVINQIILRLRGALGVTSVVVTHDIKSAFTIAQGTPQEIENSDQPWVQHFISGQALEGEAIDSGLFTMPSTSRQLRGSAITGKRVGVRGERSGRHVSMAKIDPRRGSGPQRLPPAIRNRKRSDSDVAPSVPHDAEIDAIDLDEDDEKT